MRGGVTSSPVLIALANTFTRDNKLGYIRLLIVLLCRRVSIYLITRRTRALRGSAQAGAAGFDARLKSRARSKRS
jgi:hypothetical protein